MGVVARNLHENILGVVAFRSFRVDTVADCVPGFRSVFRPSKISKESTTTTDFCAVVFCISVDTSDSLRAIFSVTSRKAASKLAARSGVCLDASRRETNSDRQATLPKTASHQLFKVHRGLSEAASILQRLDAISQCVF